MTDKDEGDSMLVSNLEDRHEQRDKHSPCDIASSPDVHTKPLDEQAAWTAQSVTLFSAYLLHAILAAIMFIGSLPTASDTYSMLVLVVTCPIAIGCACAAFGIRQQRGRKRSVVEVICVGAVWASIWIPQLFAFMFFSSKLSGHKIG